MYGRATRYRGDPHWIKTKHPCVCKQCGSAIKSNQDAFYYPRDKAFYCTRGCGQAAERDFNTMSEAEDYYGGRMRMIQRARGMMGYEDYSPQILSEVKMLPCGTCRKKTPHRKFSGKYYCDMCGDMYTQARRVKRARKSTKTRKTARTRRK